MFATVTTRLALEDGSVWTGQGFGTRTSTVGEIVFNTSLTGYQEILTDPSYAGQIVVMTAPEVGNVGINPEDHESARAWLRGFVVRALSPRVSNWRATSTLAEWLADQEIPAIAGIDTRALTRRLRERGSLRAVLSSDPDLPDEALVEQARAWPGLDGVDLVETVTCAAPYHWSEPTPAAWHIPGTVAADTPLHVVAYDFGLKRNTLRRLAAYGCHITVVPARTGAAEVLALAPDGVLLSNGPGDPSTIPHAVEATQLLLGRVPLLGICMGQQILGQALGGRTYRLKFGHHGGNQPVSHLPTGRVEISAHNHNFAVDPATLPPEVEITHTNLNDGCCEGIRHRALRALSVQYHPEAGPGPHDADPIFAEFVRMMQDERAGDAPPPT